MNRSFLLAASLGAALLAGCAATGDTASKEGDLVERVRQELALDPLLNTSRLTFAERDGVLVIGGFAEDLEDMNAIRDTIEGVDGVTEIQNDVVVQAGS